LGPLRGGKKNLKEVIKKEGKIKTPFSQFTVHAPFQAKLNNNNNNNNNHHKHHLSSSSLVVVVVMYGDLVSLWIVKNIGSYRRHWYYEAKSHELIPGVQRASTTTLRGHEG
jgi:DNA modification methylase